MTAAPDQMTAPGGPAGPAAAVTTWLEEFGAELTAGDAGSAAAMFTRDCYWRDLIAFTWNIKTMEGRGEITDMLRRTLGHIQPTGWRLTPGEEVTEAGGVTEAWIDFETAAGPRPRSRAAAGGQLLDAADHGLRAQGS